ncbi:glycosyltransferase family 2 protein [Flavobacteriaceae bacterium MHTCC 0001]
MYDIAVVLINYNSSDFTLNAIDSIRKNTPKTLDYEIIVVDNASKYEDFKLLNDKLDNLHNLKLVRSKINTGFGGGNMFGIHFANAKYYAFVNNDTILKNDCLSIILEFMQDNSHVGLCAPQGYDEKGNVLKSFDYFLTPKRELFGRKLFQTLYPSTYIKRNKIYSSPTKVQCIPGSFLCVDASVFNTVGGFDTNIFLYYEETDLAYRISKLQDKNECFLVPDAQYIHFRGASTPKSLLIKKEIKLSMLYVLKKHYSYISYLMVKYLITLKYIFKALINPKYFTLVNVLVFKSGSISKSLKQSQKILSE